MVAVFCKDNFVLINCQWAQDEGSNLYHLKVPWVFVLYHCSLSIYQQLRPCFGWRAVLRKARLCVGLLWPSLNSSSCRFAFVPSVHQQVLAPVIIPVPSLTMDPGPTLRWKFSLLSTLLRITGTSRPSSPSTATLSSWCIPTAINALNQQTTRSWWDFRTWL